MSAELSANAPPYRDRWGHRVAVIGDVGGQLEALRDELRQLGADEDSGALPDDLVIVQVGDLVHRGPDSPGVVALVDRYLREQPGQWIQLAGNHEAHYLGAVSFDWPERLDDDTATVLRRWWSDGLMTVAVELHDINGEDILLTHAGLTEGYWRRILGAPADAGRTVQLLNARIGSRDELLFRAGHMLGGGRPDFSAGPLWASAGGELVPSWLHVRLPFSQIHGHTSLFDWEHRRFLADPSIARLTTIDEQARHETTSLDGGRIIGVDPGHGQSPATPWRSWSPTATPAR